MLSYSRYDHAIWLWGGNNTTHIQYLPLSEKKVLDEYTAGCWLRFKIKNDGTLQDDPWAAFWLREDGKYWRIDAADNKINVDTNISDNTYIPDKNWASWWQDAENIISIYANDFEQNITSRAYIHIEGYYAQPARSLLAHTYVTESNWTADTTTTHDYRDMIIKDQDYKLLIQADDIHPLCKKLKSLQ